MYHLTMTKINQKIKAKWGLERRLQFIDFRLRWEGRLNRKDLMEQFGVSLPQSSLDIAKYLELAPNNLAYDLNSKSYSATANFQPVFVQSSAQQYLAQLLAAQTGLLDVTDSFVGAGIEVDFAPVPNRALDDEAVAALVRAIKGRRSVSVRYQSMSSFDMERVLSPLSFGYDGFRWHVRGFCHRRNRFSDFVLTRISNIRDEGAAPISLQDDFEWNTKISLIIIPHPDLPKEKQAAVAYDYGMVNGEFVLPCRQAFLFYTLKHLGLSGTEVAGVTHIALKNQEEVQQYLDSVRKRDSK